jgi:hypothetical protein
MRDLGKCVCSPRAMGFGSSDWKTSLNGILESVSRGKVFSVFALFERFQLLYAN